MLKKGLIPVWIGILVMSGMFLMGQDTWPPTLECVDFEDPAPGSMYVVGDTFPDSGADVNARQFEWSNGTWTSSGNMLVDSASWCDSGGSGQNLTLNNINAEIIFPVSIDNGLTINIGEYGGNVNLMINGIHENKPTFGDMPPSVGGVTVTCTGAACTGGGTGVLRLEGVINSIYIGGQEFCIDDVCPIL